MFNFQFPEHGGKAMLGIAIKRVALPDTSLAFYAVTSVKTLLFRLKVVWISQAATVDKLLAPFSGFVVEEARKISLA